MTKAEIQQVKQRFGIIGNTEALSRAIDVAIQVAPTDLSVLITGESGVGKESFPHCSDMRKVRLPVRLANGKGTLAKLTVVLFFLMK